MSFFEQRRKELGINQPDNFIQNRKMDLGIIPDTRPKSIEPVQQESKSNWFADSQKAIYNKTLKPVQDFTNRTATSFLNSTGLGQPTKILQNNQPDNVPSFVSDMYRPAETTSEKVADVTGFLGGTVAPYSLAYKTAGKGLQLGYNFLTKGIVPASKLGKALLNAGHLSAGGLGAGLGYGVASQGADELLNPNDSTFGERAKIVAIEGALGAVGDPALRALGVGLKKAYKSYSPSIKNKVDGLIGRFKKGEINEEQLKDEILMLPEGKTILRARETPQPIKENFVSAKKNPSYYADRLEEFRNVAMSQNLPPGREKEAMEEIWRNMSRYDESITLDKLIELGTPSLKQLNKRTSGNLKNPAEPNQFGVSKADQLGVNTRLKDNPINFTMLDKKPLEYVGRMAPMNKVKIQKGTSELTPKLAQRETTPLKAFNLTSKDTNIEYPFETGGLKPSLQASKEAAAGSLRGLEPKLKPLSANQKGLEPPPLKSLKLQGDKLKPIDYTPDKVKAIVKDAVKKIDFSKLKDFSGFKYNSTDIYRNMRDVFKGRYPQIKKMIIDPFNSSKNDFTEMQKTLTKSLKENVVDKLGITKGSKLSKAVQDYGEKKLPLEELKRLHPKDWEKVIEADKYFRQTYDNILHTINTTRAKIYPNNPEKQIPKRADYYRHFREMNDLVGLKNIFESPSAIDPSLVGVSEFTRPGSKFQGFMQKRGLGKYKSDAVGGFLEYIPGASYATHIDPHINVFKRLGNEIVERTASTRNMNNLINYLDKYSKDLAGKTNAADRWLQDNIPGGRKTMGVVRWVNNRVKKNTILGNAASALAQLGNVPNGIAATKQYAVKGAAQSMKDITKRNEALVNQSPFLNERYLGKSFRKFDTRWFEQPMRGAVWMIETADRIGTEFIWNSAYQQALGKNIPNPIDYADDLTRRMVAGRGVGEVPILQKSNVFQVLAPFQLEVANAWRVMGDFVKDKDATAIMTLFVASYMFNKGMEEIRGSGVVFDPIDAIIEALKPGLTPLERGGRLAGEIGSNIPFGQNLASAYPEYGTEIFGQKLPSREKLFGDEDPTRFGGGLVATKSLTDPLRYGALPFGGNQVSKTYRGAKSLVQGGLQKDDKLRFPVESTPSNVAKGLLFGPAGTKEGKEYYKSNMRPLSEKQTLTVKRSSDSKATYDRIQKKRRMDTINRKMDAVRKDKELSKKKRDKQLEILRAELKEVRGY